MFYAEVAPGLRLGLFGYHHAAELHACLLANREHLGQELPWLAEPFTQDDVAAYIRAGLERLAGNNGFRAGLWQDAQLAGCLSLHSLKWDDGQASLGYWLAAGHQGRGLITRAGRVVIAHAFTELALERLEIQCASDNHRSQRVAERWGFQREGVLRRSWRRQGQLVDQALYSLLRTEWRPA